TNPEPSPKLTHPPPSFYACSEFLRFISFPRLPAGASNPRRSLRAPGHSTTRVTLSPRTPPPSPSHADRPAHEVRGLKRLLRNVSSSIHSILPAACGAPTEPQPSAGWKLCFHKDLPRFATIAARDLALPWGLSPANHHRPRPAAHPTKPQPGKLRSTFRIFPPSHTFPQTPTNRCAPRKGHSSLLRMQSHPQLPVASGAPTEPLHGAGKISAARGQRRSHGAPTRRRQNLSCPWPAALPRSPYTAPATSQLPVSSGAPTEPLHGAGNILAARGQRRSHGAPARRRPEAFYHKDLP
ncbi:hypothetical protein E4U39_008022, partial [Claviceps sp. Clav50 group G5]